jgi:asparagine synthase (glutamine-hydrolysing)
MAFETSGQSNAPFGILQVWEVEGSVALVLGRIYYKQDAVARLSGYDEPKAAHSRDNNAALVLHTYKSLGIHGVCQLEGDYAIVIWDSSRKQLLAIRDPFGGYPIYWSKTATSLVVSTSMRRLRRYHRGSLNREYLAAYLTARGSGWHELPSTDCPYEGVQRLEPGTYLSSQLAASQIVISSFWNWSDHIIDPTSNELSKLSEEFCALLRGSIRERSIGCTMCHLSGGLDSSSVTLLAQQTRQAALENKEIHTVSLVYERLPYLARERRYIDAVLTSNKSLIPHFIPADSLKGYSDIPYHEEPWPALFWSAPEAAIFDVAANAQANSLLTGHGSDEQIGLEPYHLADDVQRGRWLQVWREAGLWAEECECNRWDILFPYAIANLLPSFLRDGVKPMLQGGYTSWDEQGFTTVAPWIKKSFSREKELYRRGRDTFRRIFRSHSPTQFSLTLFGLRSHFGDPSRWNFGLARGVHLAHPFLDPRVVSLGLGIQRSIRATPGPTKPILTNTLSDILPEELIDRGHGGHFNEYFFGGLAERAPWLRAVIRSAPIEELEIFDKDELLRCLDYAALGIAKDASTFDRLHLSLSLIIWLFQELAPDGLAGSKLQ